MTGQNCTDSLCNQTPTRSEGLTLPSCVSGDDCADNLEVCDTATGLCDCGEGAGRSSTTGVCQWTLDKACLACEPCTSTCPGEHMVCNTGLRTCVCAHGYQMDETGLSCSLLDGTTTGIDCTHINDCNQLPHSICSPYTGKCQCRKGYCYVSRQCVADMDLCVDLHGRVSPSVNTVCHRPRCLQHESDGQEWRRFKLAGLVSLSLLRRTVTFNWTLERSCTATEDCKLWKNNTHCSLDKCTCINGSVVSDGECVKDIYGYCQKDSDCPLRYDCQYRQCATKLSLYQEYRGAIPLTVDAEGIGVGISVVGVVALCGLLVISVIKDMRSKKNTKELKLAEEFGKLGSATLQPPLSTIDADADAEMLPMIEIHPTQVLTVLNSAEMLSSQINSQVSVKLADNINTESYEKPVTPSDIEVKDKEDISSVDKTTLGVESGSPIKPVDHPAQDLIQLKSAGKKPNKSTTKTVIKPTKSSISKTKKSSISKTKKSSTMTTGPTSAQPTTAAAANKERPTSV